MISHFKPSSRIFSLRVKLFLLFFLVPLILLLASVFISIRIMDDLNERSSKESSRIVNGLAEQIIEEKAKSVAAQIHLYLSSHYLLKPDLFDTIDEFKNLAVQKVGKTGYTALYSLPGSDGIWRTWAHTNPKIIGINMMNLEKPLGRNFQEFWNIYSGVTKEQDSKGYYTWQDADGKFREKFMVCTNVKGTDYIIAATTYLEEFNKPLKQLNKKSSDFAESARTLFFCIIAGAALLGGLIVLNYGFRITNRIHLLTQLAERISIGELEAKIDTKEKDEIGDLARAIVMMQDSIRLAIKRLRKRRHISAA